MCTGDKSLLECRLNVEQGLLFRTKDSRVKGEETGVMLSGWRCLAHRTGSFPFLGHCPEKKSREPFCFQSMDGTRSEVGNSVLLRDLVPTPRLCLVINLSYGQCH